MSRAVGFRDAEAFGFSNSGYVSTLQAAALGIMAGVITSYGGLISVGAALGVSLIILWPVQFALGMFAFLIPFDRISTIGTEAAGATLTRYVGALVIVVLLGFGLVAKRLSTPPRAALWWTAFVLWGALTLGWAIDPRLAWGKVSTVFSLLLLYLVATSFRLKPKELSALTLMTILGGCVAALMAGFSFFESGGGFGGDRATLAIGNQAADPNGFCASLLLPLSLAIGVFVQKRERAVRLAALLVIAIIAFAQLMTMSRGGLAAVLTVIFVYAYRLKASRRILTPIISLALLLLWMPHSFFARFSLADRGAGRADIWLAGLSLLPRHGILGAGWDNFAVAYDRVAGSAPVFRGFSRAAHNIYLGSLVEVGVVGLVLLLLAFRTQLKEATGRHLVPYEAACWGMLVTGLTLDVLWHKAFWMTWILLAMAVRTPQEDGTEMAAANTSGPQVSRLSGRFSISPTASPLKGRFL